MTTSTQPIALPSNNNFDYQMADASFNSSSGPFNPASYTRQFIGSPISWRASPSSWGSRIPVGSPTAHLLSNFEAGKTPPSTESDRGSILNALNVFDREGELCRNYTCCGLHLNDLHALLEHFEDVHIVVLDPTAPQPQAHIQIPFNPQINEFPSSSSAQSSQVYHQRQRQQSHLDPDDMELELDLDNSTQPAPPSSSSHSSPSSGAPSPPDTPISTPLSAYPSPHAFIPHHLPHLNGHLSPYISQQSSPLSATSSSTRQSSPTGTTINTSLRPNLNLNLSSFPRSHLSSPSILAHPEEAFNTYARFSSDYSSCLPGAQYNSANQDDASAVSWQQMQLLQAQMQVNGGISTSRNRHPNLSHLHQQSSQQLQPGGCLPPALLFSSSPVETPVSTPAGSRLPSPTPGSTNTSPVSASGGKANGRAITINGSGNTNTNTVINGNLPANTLRPANSLLLSKPFRCPKPNCNKSYKQANGLKYHMTHGSCNFAPPKDLEHVKDLLERKRRERERERENGAGTGVSLNRSLSCGSTIIGGGASSDGYSITASSSTSPPSPSTPSSPSHPSSTTTTTPSTPTLPSNLDTCLLSTYDLTNITETELREVEREAEKRLRPFACGVGDCQRRYKNMNGLRYHYQHSGDHGAVGLALLASGQHECLVGHVGKRGGGVSGGQHGQSQGHPMQVQHQQNQVQRSGDEAEREREREREGRKRMLIKTGTGGLKGSMSVPVSRAGSKSRSGTPDAALMTTTNGMNTAPTTTLMTTPIQVMPVGVNRREGASSGIGGVGVVVGGKAVVGAAGTAGAAVSNVSALSLSAGNKALVLTPAVITGGDSGMSSTSTAMMATASLSSLTGANEPSVQHQAQQTQHAQPLPQHSQPQAQPQHSQTHTQSQQQMSAAYQYAHMQRQYQAAQAAAALVVQGGGIHVQQSYQGQVGHSPVQAQQVQGQGQVGQSQGQQQGQQVQMGSQPPSPQRVYQYSSSPLQGQQSQGQQQYRSPLSQQHQQHHQQQHQHHQQQQHQMSMSPVHSPLVRSPLVGERLVGTDTGSLGVEPGYDEQEYGLVSIGGVEHGLGYDSGMFDQPGQQGQQYPLSSIPTSQLEIVEMGRQQQQYSPVEHQQQYSPQHQQYSPHMEHLEQQQQGFGGSVIYGHHQQQQEGQQMYNVDMAMAMDMGEL